MNKTEEFSVHGGLELLGPKDKTQADKKMSDKHVG